MILLSKYWRILLPVGLLVLFITVIQVWKADIKDAVVYEIKAQASDLIIEDITTTIEIFKPNKTIDQIANEIIKRDEDFNDSIVTYPDDWVQQSENNYSDRLLSTESNPDVSDQRNTKTGSSVGNERGLSAQEIDSIREFSKLLQ